MIATAIVRVLVQHYQEKQVHSSLKGGDAQRSFQTNFADAPMSKFYVIILKNNPHGAWKYGCCKQIIPLKFVEN